MNRQKYEDIADQLSKDVKISASVKFTRILCHAEKELCDKAGVKSFPAFKFYVAGKLHHFAGGYDLEKISLFVTAGWQQSTGETWSPFTPESGTTSTSAGSDFPISTSMPETTSAASRSLDVIELDEEDFDQSIGHNGPWLVRFFVPWCRFSRELTPIWKKLGADMKGRVNVAEVNCDEEKRLQERFGITGYPTVKLFRDGKVYNYDGNRTEEDLVDFVERRWRVMTPLPMPKKGHRRFFSYLTVSHLLITIGAALILLSLLGLVVLVVMKRRREAAVAAHGQYLYSPVAMVEKGEVKN